MTKDLKWRLGKLPTPDEVLKLVNDKLITKEEARDILFKEENKTERDEKSLEEEIKFLRELVEKLSNNNQSKIIETIRYIEKPYIHWNWYQPYQVYCSCMGLNTVVNSEISTNTGQLQVVTDNLNNQLNQLNCSSGTGGTCTNNFCSIQTF